MQNKRRRAACALALAGVCAAGLVVAAQEQVTMTPLREGDTLMSELRYEDAIAAYQKVRASDDARVRVRAGAGIARALLRMGQFTEALDEGSAIVARDPANPVALALHGETLWAVGRFYDAEKQYAAALALDANDAAALHGRARSLLSRSQTTEALQFAERAVAADPNEIEFLHTLAAVHEAKRDYGRAADVLARYAAALPDSERSHVAKWARTQEQFLRGFGRRAPLDVVSTADVITVPIRIVDGRVLVDGSVNGRTAAAFALDTGTDLTILTPALAQRAGVEASATMQTAGVGAVGLGYRDLELGRIDELQIGGLRIRNVPSVIKNPALAGLPRPEGAGFSPLALGFSMVIDYSTRELTMTRRLPETAYAARLPLRMQRLPIVQATVNGGRAASFAIDTAGDGNAISRRLARTLDVKPELRLVSARVFGSAGWDPSAFLLPYVTIELAPKVGPSGGSVVVLNLDAPSGLLGFDLGGIIGHEFLQRYRVSIDLVRSEVGLDPIR
jgi:tetratricopeptide (TPR) repeat protein